jgi:hypothetical protein
MTSSHHISFELAAARARELREEARRSSRTQRQQARAGRRRSGVAARLILRASRRRHLAHRELRAPGSRG